MTRKFFTVLLACTLLVTLNPNNAFAGSWSTQFNSGSVPGGNTFTTYFIPGVVGDHQIDFLNENCSCGTGIVDIYWGSSSNPTVWHWFTGPDVTQNHAYVDLYAGSSDIIFKFVYRNQTGSPHTFYYRFYTD